MLRTITASLATLLVIAALAFFATGGTFRFAANQHWQFTPYPALAEGFLKGQLHLAVKPDPKLLALPNPWDFEARKGLDAWWDISYLNGRYYLYFSPLPALLIYMPSRLITGLYPGEPLVGFLLSVWIVLAAVAFLRAALRDRAAHVPLALWVLLAGLGNVLLYTLTEVRFYEVAILTGTAMTTTWAWALLRFFEKPTAVRAAWMSLWLALAILARPNLGMIVIATVAAILLAPGDRRGRLRISVAAAVPLIIVGGAMLWYNVARFRRPLEFGQSYMLSYQPQQAPAVCSLCSFADLTRFANYAWHYTSWSPVVRSEFPYVFLRFSSPDEKTRYPMNAEQVVGVAAFIPLVIPGTLFAILLGCAGVSESGARAAMLVVAAAWLVLFGLSTCGHVVTRYVLDHSVLMTLGSIVAFERGLDWLAGAGVRIAPMRLLAVMLACLSIVAGVLIAFDGPAGAFRRTHPTTFEQAARWLS